ncbi:hypothetical protein, partial [Morganella morganii]|uniref:hypothetical protein n=1 Tax=Morganella morganii TaxID=582 RepID=UPI00195458F4
TNRSSIALAMGSGPVDGLIFPDQFISIAEASGLIDKLTRVVFMGAMTQVKAWEEAHLPLLE